MSILLANVGAADQISKLTFYLADLTLVCSVLYSLVQVNFVSGPDFTTSLPVKADLTFMSNFQEQT
jgi:hypothetical protein